MKRGRESAKRRGIFLGMALLGTFLKGYQIAEGASKIADSPYWRTAYAAAARGDRAGVLAALMGESGQDPFGNHLFGEIANKLLADNPLMRDGLIGLYSRLWKQMLSILALVAELDAAFGPELPVLPEDTGPPQPPVGITQQPGK